MDNIATHKTPSVITHSTAAFTWIPERKEFVAERSDFGAEKPWTVLKGTPYFYLYNPLTDNKVLFVFLRTLENDGPDYEIESWVFGALPEEIEKNPRLHGVQVVFIND